MQIERCQTALGGTLGLYDLLASDVFIRTTASSVPSIEF
ncbi:hypothetical protein TBK1r_06590 [Stieleria magnilauensis]|uniref:Uncharacterized protein n=1 Tax=Stieleria magnilauensis TaxID=2527963 RepID=A0ABX5XIN8_9BACT|nr:hypothetical protein TBK1r_06590 [Planctomycetes bacterium TBK1r]